MCIYPILCSVISGPLHWAAHKENVSVALFLVENGANVLQGDRNGTTPLSMASPELATKMIGQSQFKFV